MNNPFVLLHGVAVQFGNTTVFRDVSLKLARGEVAVVVGESGVGKSTLLRAIAGQGPFSGRIEIEGKEPPGPDDDKATRGVVLVPQHAFLWDHLTAADNVALVRRIVLREARATAKKHARSFLEKLEVDDVAHRYPFRLSGGEQQRVSLARGLAAEADLYLLDEITAHLDPRRRESIAILLKDLAAQGKTLIVATHDRRFARELSERPLQLTEHGLAPMSGSDNF